MSEGPGQPATENTSASGEVAASTYRCFLFADLRGYTALMDRIGNAAGAALLNEYLAITRAAVARHHGAEIKVEGDGFHAVFPSASSAVMCGLAIVEAADEANKTQPDRPIRVGVGIHAGEAIETPDGFIGSAVNIAARVCGAAAAGEVLVTGTVRGITQASISVGFVSRGRQRLKGLADPIDLYSVMGDRTKAAAAGSRGNWAILVGALIVVAILFVATALAAQSPNAPNSPTAKATPSPSAGPPAIAIGTLDVGSYAADQFQPPFDFVVSDPGWSVYRSGAEFVGLFHESAPEGHFDIGRIEGVYVDACIRDGDTKGVGSTPLELVGAIQEIPFLTVERSEAITAAGRAGVAVDVDIDEGALAACGSFGTGEVQVFPVGSETWTGHPGERVRIVAVDVNGTTVSMILSAEAAASSSVAELHAFFELADRVIESMTFR